jgi:hypothetical protein
MTMDVEREVQLTEALRLTAAPSRAWIDAAALIPSTLGDLDALERLLEDPGFRDRFQRDPLAAVRDAGLPESEPVLSALRARLG